MRETRLTLPQLAMIAGTRGALGAGVGLLLGDRLSDCQRRAVGWTLLCVGVATTIPLALQVLSNSRVATGGKWTELSPEDILPAHPG